MRTGDQASGRAEWRRGWPVVLAAMIGVGTGPGLFQNLSSLFTPGMIAEFGWTRGQIATAAGLGLVGGLAAPFLGRLTDRIGVRAMIVTAMLLLGAAYAGLAVMSGRLWQYQLAVFCLALTVPGTGALVYGKLVSARFVAHRGLALAVATSGLSITTLLLPPAIAAAISLWGWRGGFVTLAIMVAGIALPLVLLAIREAPRDGPDPALDPDAAPATGMTGREARRSARFWALGLTALFINVATNGLVTQLVPFGLDRGLSAGQAALLLASFGASQIVGRFAMGFLVDRFAAPPLAAIAAAISAAAFVGLQLDAPGFALAMALIFAAGLMNGAEHDLLPYLTGKLFGLKSYGEVYGSLLVLALLGTATGIVGFGRLHDATGDYSVALWIAAAGLVAAAGLFLTLGGADSRD
ncbi:MFS transporter [Sphingomonas sp.]|jgi:predicted MFS family arabinose efflux permease|uniref:MFS transporter n=1 Tax=Sphingomonas sp. TaxID=28214 RepID=UPI002D7F3D20|nr:MFS transporter [Sphingomonas sp.]HEU0045452.1 MFS transporter [Sphingomonas sp.]